MSDTSLGTCVGSGMVSRSDSMMACLNKMLKTWNQQPMRMYPRCTKCKRPTRNWQRKCLRHTRHSPMILSATETSPRYTLCSPLPLQLSKPLPHNSSMHWLRCLNTSLRRRVCTSLTPRSLGTALHCTPHRQSPLQASRNLLSSSRRLSMRSQTGTSQQHSLSRPRPQCSNKCRGSSCCMTH